MTDEQPNPQVIQPTVSRCETCHAMIVNFDIERHQAWHDQLDARILELWHRDDV